MSRTPKVDDLYRRNVDGKLFQIMDIKNVFTVTYPHEGHTEDTFYTLVEVSEKDKPLENGITIDILDYLIEKYTLEDTCFISNNGHISIDIQKESENPHTYIVLESKESVMKELEVEGEKAVLDLFRSNISLSDTPDHLLTIIKNGIDECEKRTGTEMSYLDMRRIYG